MTAKKVLFRIFFIGRVVLIHTYKLDGLRVVNNRPSIDQLNHVLQKKSKKKREKND